MQNNVLFWQSPVGYLPEPDREQIDFGDWLENLSIKIKARLFSFFFNPIFNLKNSRANSFSLRTFEMANGKWQINELGINYTTSWQGVKFLSGNSARRVKINSNSGQGQKSKL